MGDWISTASPRIRVIPGGNRGRFPFSHTLFIDDDVKAVVDTGAGEAPLSELISRTPVDLVINTHYHFDHIAYNYLFEGSRILLNRREAEGYRDRRAIGRFLGMAEVYGEAWVDGWLERIADPGTKPSPWSPQNDHKWWLSTARIDGEYAWGDVLDFGKTKAHVLAAPGHSEGFCCLFFPRDGIAYVSDMDLTSFGPWYGGTDGDIDAFVQSCRAMAALDVRQYITGHERGIVDGETFREGVETFLSKIEEREKAILESLKTPLSLKDLAGLGLIYPRKFHEDAWVFMWNFLMTQKHVRRLITRGRVKEEDGMFLPICRET